MRLRSLAAIGSLLVLFSFAAKADDSGCGLGTMIIRSNGKLLQLLALTTNASTFTQVFGITTGTSECKSSGLVMQEKQTVYFAEVNKDDLTREMAEGKGEKLTTLASLYGCSGDAALAFAKMTQSAYSRILPSADTKASEMVQNLTREVNANDSLAKSCQTI